MKCSFYFPSFFLTPSMVVLAHNEGWIYCDLKEQVEGEGAGVSAVGMWLYLGNM
jgi:hypothetical protein